MLAHVYHWHLISINWMHDLGQMNGQLNLWSNSKNDSINLHKLMFDPIQVKVRSSVFLWMESVNELNKLMNETNRIIKILESKCLAKLTFEQVSFQWHHLFVHIMGHFWQRSVYLNCLATIEKKEKKKRCWYVELNVAN